MQGSVAAFTMLGSDFAAASAEAQCGICADIAEVMSKSFGSFFWPTCFGEYSSLAEMLDSSGGVQAVAAHLQRVRASSLGEEDTVEVTEQQQKAWLIKAQGLLAYIRQHPRAKMSKGNQQLLATLAESDAFEQGLAMLSASAPGQLSAADYLLPDNGSARASLAVEASAQLSR